MTRRNTLLLLAVILLCFTLTPIYADKQVDNQWSADTYAGIGYQTFGFGASLFYRHPSGASAGISIREQTPDGTDPVVGLTDYFLMYLMPSIEVGWDFRLPLGFSIAPRLVFGAELSILNERIVDPVHGIDRNYSVFDAMFDLYGALEVRWIFWESLGLNATFLASLYDLRKSIVSVGITYGF
jgi:hypothetical protein